MNIFKKKQPIDNFKDSYLHINTTLWKTLDYVKGGY